jgi:hypothetical protein
MRSIRYAESLVCAVRRRGCARSKSAAYIIYTDTGHALYFIRPQLMLNVIAGTPNFVGQTWKRWFTFDGPNRVSLRVDGPSPPMVENTLIWERVQKR